MFSNRAIAAHLWWDDCVAPLDYFESLARRQPSPEQNLLLAVLVDAIRQLEKGDPTTYRWVRGDFDVDCKAEHLLRLRDILNMLGYTGHSLAAWRSSLLAKYGTIPNGARKSGRQARFRCRAYSNMATHCHTWNRVPGRPRKNQDKWRWGKNVR